MNGLRKLTALLLLGSALTLVACSQPTPAPAGGTESGAPAVQPVGGGQPGTDYPKPSDEYASPTEAPAGYVPPSTFTETPMTGYPSPITGTEGITATQPVTGQALP